MILAIAFADLAGQLAAVFHGIVLPILLLAGLGFCLQRLLGLDMATLRYLNFYYVMPATIYYSIVTSRLTVSAVGVVVCFMLGLLATQGTLTYLVGRGLGVPADVRRALMMTTMFCNSGNYGLPLQELAFESAGRSAQSRAVALQAFVMLTQNLTNFTVGILLVSGGRKDRHWLQNLRHVAKFPPLYAMLAGVATVVLRHELGPGTSEKIAGVLSPLWQVLLWVRSAFVAVALLTLGAQLGRVSGARSVGPVRLSVFLRLLVGPLIGLGLVYLLGLRGLDAQILLIATSTPTAVNVMLLCLEFDNHPEYAGRAVFYSTLLSPLTVTLTIFLARSGLLPGF